MLRKAEFINAENKYDYEYKIDAIEQFLDKVEQRNHDWAVKYITPMVDDAKQLDFNDYDADHYEEDVYSVKKQSEELNEKIYKEQSDNFEMKYRKDFDENLKKIWEVDDYKGAGYIGGSKGHLERMVYTDPRVADYASVLLKILKGREKDDKLIRATFSADLKALKVARENLKERKISIKKQKESLKKFVDKYGKIALEFDLEKVSQALIEECAWEFAKIARWSIRAEIYRRTEEYVGKLVSMEQIHWGENGSLNGVVIGEKGDKADVKTIIAGGYNIQCEHYRVLVKPLR